MRMLTTVTATSMMFIGSRSWSSATAQIEGGFSLTISFVPTSTAGSLPQPGEAGVNGRSRPPPTARTASQA